MGRFRRSLLSWYHSGHRDLPWRQADARTGRPAPYRVLVSEVMLQQTQVRTVLDYYRRFLARFPSVAALADADEHEVLCLWQGLGYYRRARLLHAAARRIVTAHGGRVPRKAGELESLPGVGRSTAGAVASIAYGEAAPILDGNVKRVLARLHDIGQPVGEPDVQRLLWGLSGELVRAGDPGEVNQALMELGATVCTPRGPACGRCPVSRSCLACQRGTADRVPVAEAKRAPKAVKHHVLAVRRGGRYLFRRRPDDGLWAGMWEMPTMEGVSKGVGDVLPPWVTERLGVVVSSPVRVGSFEHMTTHRRIGFTVWAGDAVGGRLRPGAGVWRVPGRVEDLPMSNPQRRAVEMVYRAGDRAARTNAPTG